ncbi:hypothetical protein ACVIIW_002507 [Bradyrhizobium sp. USDA 4449]
MLNDTRIRNAKTAERDYKLTDFDCAGLQEWQPALAFRIPL